MRAESGSILRELLEFGDLHRRRSDGAARPRGRHSGERHAASRCATIVARSIITRAIPSTTAISITSSACCT